MTEYQEEMRDSQRFCCDDAGQIFIGVELSEGAVQLLHFTASEEERPHD